MGKLLHLLKILLRQYNSPPDIKSQNPQKQTPSDIVVAFQSLSCLMEKFLCKRDLLSLCLSGYGVKIDPKDFVVEYNHLCWSNSQNEYIQRFYEALPDGTLHGKTFFKDSKGVVYGVKEWKFGKLVTPTSKKVALTYS
ncbi:hypothetical protein GMAR_ORF25 [Golden Marseillevirus]|uniref:hypothetical protein n=1 Tax=Golden Marseillevirus TaxID=1720526 RepID=UPI000877A924|nr:hypothetical protein GMAR_ORF25 [Golden Marseillevirus]ALX27400.1 hypothetical protein GMAR_ORF25 [Golden Marseillevirus]